MRFRLRLRDSGPAALCRSSYSHVGLILSSSRGTAEALAHLQRIVVTGEEHRVWDRRRSVKQRVCGVLPTTPP